MNYSLTRRTAVIFLGIILFIGTQLIWWYIFLSHQQQDSFVRTRHSWQREQSALQKAYSVAVPSSRSQLVELCRKEHPHLTCKGPLFTVRSEALSKLANQQRRYRRMFLFEGLFFLMVVFLGHMVIWQGVRAERELKERQQNFLSAVSHEIRTPISTMRLILETLQMRKLPEAKQAHYLKRLEHQLNRLQNSGEQVVAAAKLSDEKSESPMVNLDLNKEAKRVVEQDRFELESRGATVTLETLPSTATVKIDPLSFEMLLHNLLDNAVKYNDKEDKQLRVALKASTKHIQLWVEDNGPGIAPEEQEKVFTPFYRVGQELTRQSDGLGLGLYLVKGMCEQMKGTVKYEALEVGSRFVLEWPRSKETSTA